MTINCTYTAAIASVRHKGKAQATTSFTVAGMQCAAPTPFYRAIQDQLDGLRKALELIAEYPTHELLDPKFWSALTPEEQALARQCVWHLLCPGTAEPAMPEGNLRRRLYQLK